MSGLGDRLKTFRQRAALSLRELARQADVSPSLVSQIENGKSRPSVSTLYTFARLLNVAVDDLLDAAEQGVPQVSPGPDGDAGRDPANAWHPSEYANRISVVHPSHRARLGMGKGIGWERLAATPERDVNFMRITYAPGMSSPDGGELQTHEGYEYGYVLAGSLEVTVGNEVFVLREGESLGFDSTIPHRLRNVGHTDVQGIWFVHGATGPALCGRARTSLDTARPAASAAGQQESAPACAAPTPPMGSEGPRPSRSSAATP